MSFFSIPGRGRSAFPISIGMLSGMSLVVWLALSASAFAQDRPAPLDVLDLDVTVSSETSPDLAVVTLAVTREGSDAATLTPDVNQTLARALAQAKAVAGVQAATGGYSTSQRLDSKGQRNGWQVRAELVLKSKDFTALSQLSGKLSAPPLSLQISSAGFEVSPELRSTEESALIERGIAAFKSKAAQAVKAFGYGSYTVREVTLGQAGLSGGPRPMMAMKAMAAPMADSNMPMESGRVTLQLSVNGSVQMRH